MPNRPSSKNNEQIGTIVGLKAGCVVVRLADGSEILCRGVKKLHRPWGFFALPIGRLARVRFAEKRKRPLIVEVLPK